ncbi:MAG: hypothetical protein K2N56_12695 [Oscillospiraceae bacterium]|nr:hypothetical protein [Oscillospiraceae bacterium]
MKKLITCGISAALCMSALSSQAFAEDILSDRSVYVFDRDQIAKAAGSTEWDGEPIYVDPNTVMPAYETEIYDYARTGKFDVKPFRHDETEESQVYIADAINRDGDYVGKVEFTLNGGMAYTPKTDKANSVAFAPNAKRISAIMAKQKISSDCIEVKLLYVNEIGFVYYIDNGTSKFIAAANVTMVNAEILNEENGGIIEIGDELKAFADRKLAEYEEYKREVLDKLDPNEPPPVGGSETPPMFMADNTPYLDGAEEPSVPDKNDNPNTGSAPAGKLGIALATCVIGISAAKKKKDQ